MAPDDFVERTLGEGDARFGRVVSASEDDDGIWLVTAGGHTYRDPETALIVRPRASTESEANR